MTTQHFLQGGGNSVGRGRVAPNVEDRNRGQGLPSGLSDESFGKLQAALDRRRPGLARTAALVEEAAPVAEPTFGRRFASVAAVEAAGFERVSPGFYREAGAHIAHPIWELRGMEDDSGHVLLVRRREERVVDLRASAGAGTDAAVSAGIIHRAGMARTAAGGSKFQVSLLQTPGGDIQDRRTLFSNTEMDLDDIARLVSEIKLGPQASLTHDTWSDGEYELRIRGPRGQLIHEYDSVGPDEIGGAKGAKLIGELQGVIENGPANSHGGEGPPLPGMSEEPGMEPAEPAGFLGGEPAVPAPGGAPPAEGGPAPAGGLPPAGPIAPSAAALTRGARVLVVKQGQVADAVVLMVHPNMEAVDVMFGGGVGGTVSPGDIIDPEVELGDEPKAFEDDGSGEGDDSGLSFDFGGGGGGDEAFVEISGDDLPSAGGAGQDPFDVAVSAPSGTDAVALTAQVNDPWGSDPHASNPNRVDVAAERRIEALVEQLERNGEQGGLALDVKDALERAHGTPYYEETLRTLEQDLQQRLQTSGPALTAMVRYLTACMHVNAVAFMGAFRPGAIIEPTRAFTTFYQGQQVVPDPNEEHTYTVAGFHQPGHDMYHGLQGLKDPVPGDDPYQNLRIRLEDNMHGTTVLITPEELQQYFEFARGQGTEGPTDEDLFEELPGVSHEFNAPAPGQNVDPYAQTQMSKPQAPAGVPAPGTPQPTQNQRVPPPSAQQPTQIQRPRQAPPPLPTKRGPPGQPPPLPNRRQPAPGAG